MRVFISWSKEPSRIVAEALRDWLPDVIQSLEPWMSSADIGAGARWSAKIAEALAATKIGILCVTQENQREPWLLFEAGALAKTLDDTFVCPYLIQMRAADLSPGPLTQFQAKLADREGTFDLLSTVNAALGAEALSAERLRRLFDRNWPDLEAKLGALPASAAVVGRPQEELLTEILETVRSLSRRVPPPPTAPSPEQVARMRRRARELMVQGELNRFLPKAEGREIATKLQQLTDEQLQTLSFGLRRRPQALTELPDFLVQLMSSAPLPVTPQGGESQPASDAVSSPDQKPA